MDDKKLRTLLGEMADDVSPHRTVPASLERRVHRRVAMNSAVIGTMIVALGVGAFATVRALGPNKASSIAPATSSSAVATTPACTAGQLRAIGSMDGAAGSRVGYIELRNYSAKTCTLQGTPVIALYDGSTRINTGLIFDRTVAQWQADAASKPAGWPVVTLGAMGSAHNAAQVRIRWTNWCPQGRPAPLWRVSIPGSGTVDVINGMNTAGSPPCNGAPLPSHVEVGPFEPHPAA
jgi:Protein of unknown function (DUF4232)